MRLVEPRFEQADRDEILGLQLSRLKRLLRYAEATNPFYRDLWRQGGVDVEEIDSIEAFTARVPTVGKPDFTADQALAPPYGRRHLGALESREQLVVSMTSGTSGQGQEIHVQTGPEFAITSQVYSYMYKWAGLEAGDSFFLSMPVTMLTGGQVEYQGALSYGLSTFAVGNYDAQRKLDLVAKFRPRGFLANTSYLGRLASLLDGTTDLGVKTLISGGEGSGIEWLRRVGEAWGAEVYDRYGSSQAGCDHAFCCEHGIGTPERPGLLHNVDPYFLVEVVDSETGRHVADGEQGELVITSLYHLDTPLIRCRIGDTGVYHEPGYCSCGRPFMGIETASIGRTDDMTKIKGVNVWPAAVDNVVFQYDEIADYQVLVTSSADGVDESTVRVVPAEPISDGVWGELGQRLARDLQARIGIRFRVELLADERLDLRDVKVRRWVDERPHVLARSAGRAGVASGAPSGDTTTS
jgi:phenylacetate-CoA ligase